MLYKIVISSDRKKAVVHYSSHSVMFHSDEDVMVLIWEIIIEPSIQNEKYWKEQELRFLASLDDTVEIDIREEDVA